MPDLSLDHPSLSLAEFLEVARGRRPVALGPEVRRRVARGRAAVERAVATRRPVYGITTGFGSLSDRSIPPTEAIELQRALIRSHASGTGPALPAEVVRGMMLLRLHSLARGHSGVRLELLERLAELLNQGLLPHVPEQGSVGASGDLAPLAHLGLALMGEGEFVTAEGQRRPAGETLEDAGISPWEPAEKEGVALVNGTSLMAAYLALGVADARALYEAATIAAGLSFDVLRGRTEALDDRLGLLRNSEAQRAAAAELRALLVGSTLTSGGRLEAQDPYTLRCLPQVFAAVRLAIDFAEGIAVDELGAVTDNPVIVEEGEFLHGGNFHGQPLALALDTLALGVQYLTGFSERRTARLVHPGLNRGLPPFLAPKAGLSSGFMIPQYVAAALVNEGSSLAHPASAVSLPTSADQEDFVSMGAWAGAKLRRAIENGRTVVAIEWIVSAQGLELRRPATGGVGSEAALRAIRTLVATWDRDRPPAPDIERVRAALADGSLVGRMRAGTARVRLTAVGARPERGSPTRRPSRKK